MIRSDEIRKRLCGVDPLQRLGPEGYTSDVTQRVYATMTERAATVVRAGYAAIADAVFARPADRDAIEQAAAAAGVPFVGIWLDAPQTCSSRGPHSGMVIHPMPMLPSSDDSWRPTPAGFCGIALTRRPPSITWSGRRAIAHRVAMDSLARVS